MVELLPEPEAVGLLALMLLHESRRTARTSSGGKFTVTDGPFIELKELLGGWAVLRVKSLDEAIEWSKRFRKIVGDGESEIVRVFGPEDAGPA